MMAEPPINIDAELFVKKLLERGTKPYNAETKSSPVFEPLVQNLLNKLEDLVTNNNVVMQVINDQ